MSKKERECRKIELFCRKKGNIDIEKCLYLSILKKYIAIFENV